MPTTSIDWKFFAAHYRDRLLNDTLPVWLPRCLDREHGGYFMCLDENGEIYDTDKPIWHQGRFAWLLGTLHAEVEPRAEWLEACEHGLEFLKRHAFDDDGRMFFRVTGDGRPLLKRRYVFSETFAAIAFAAHARSGNDASRAFAHELYERVVRALETPGALAPKFNEATRPMKGLAIPMILIATCQELRLADDRPEYTAQIDARVAEIRDHFMDHERRCVREVVGPNGEMLDTLEGRQINPGHAIEAAWFILREACERDRADYLELGRTILDWSWEWGWDPEHGGILYFRDALGKPCLDYWHDMKFWWQHNETLIATMIAHAMTGDSKYAEWHRLTHDWTEAHFPAPNGEWFGYLRRDGAVSQRVIGNMWKGPFHLPRQQLVCMQISEAELAKENNNES